MSYGIARTDGSCWIVLSIKSWFETTLGWSKKFGGIPNPEGEGEWQWKQLFSVRIGTIFKVKEIGLIESQISKDGGIIGAALSFVHCKNNEQKAKNNRKIKILTPVNLLY